MNWGTCHAVRTFRGGSVAVVQTLFLKQLTLTGCLYSVRHAWGPCVFCHLSCQIAPDPPPLFCALCSLPVLLPSIQERLLDVLSLILAKKPFRPPSAASPLARSPSLGSPVLQSELTAAGLTQLALRTLATFDLTVSRPTHSSIHSESS